MCNDIHFGNRGGYVHQMLANASSCHNLPITVLLPSWEINSFSFPEAIFSLSVPAALNWTCAAADRRYEVTVWMYIATANACANPTAHQHRSPPPCAKPSHIFFSIFLSHIFFLHITPCIIKKLKHKLRKSIIFSPSVTI